MKTIPAKAIEAVKKTAQDIKNSEEVNQAQQAKDAIDVSVQLKDQSLYVINSIQAFYGDIKSIEDLQQFMEKELTPVNMTFRVLKCQQKKMKEPGECYECAYGEIPLMFGKKKKKPVGQANESSCCNIF